MQDLAQAIYLMHRGIYQLEPSIMGKLMGALHAPGLLPSIATKPHATALSKPLDEAIPEAQIIREELSEREIEVLRLIATGATNRETGRWRKLMFSLVERYGRDARGPEVVQKIARVQEKLPND